MATGSERQLQARLSLTNGVGPVERIPSLGAVSPRWTPKSRSLPKMLFDAVCPHSGHEPALRRGRGGPGQSAATIDKERRIAACLSVGMKIAEAKFGQSGFAYWHLDANAGSGWNEEVNVPGSPLVFWQVANLYLNGLGPRAFFCDRDPQT